MRDRAVERVSAAQLRRGTIRAIYQPRPHRRPRRQIRSNRDTAPLRSRSTYLAEDIAEFRVSITEEQRQALLSGISEYSDGDEELFRAYARLLKSSDSKAME